MNHPDEMSKLSKVKAQITEVKGIMMDNIEKVNVISFDCLSKDMMIIVMLSFKNINNK